MTKGKHCIPWPVISDEEPCSDYYSKAYFCLGSLRINSKLLRGGSCGKSQDQVNHSKNLRKKGHPCSDSKAQAKDLCNTLDDSLKIYVAVDSGMCRGKVAF